MSIHIKDFAVGQQKEDGLHGSEAYAYARLMQAVRESNPNAVERIVPLKYKAGSIALFASSLVLPLPINFMVIVAGFVVYAIGTTRKYERPINR